MRNPHRFVLGAVVILVAAGCGKEGAPSRSGSGGGGTGGAAAGTGGAAAGTGGAAAGTGGSAAGTGGTGGRGTGGTGGATSGTGGAGAAGGGGGRGGSSAGSGGVADTGGGGGGDGGGGAAGATAPGREIVYVGSNAPDISVYAFDATSGTLTLMGSKVTTGSIPSFMVIEPTKKYLYTVNEYMARLVAFSIDRATGGLKMLNAISSGGDDPAFIGVDGGGKYVLVANYNAGSTGIFRIGADGMLGSSTDTKMPGMNAHMLVTDPSNQYAFVPCKGSDYIAQYRFDASAGTLAANNPARVTTKPGAGPRHLAFHPTRAYAYLINELDSTMNAYSLASGGTLTELQSLSTLPANATGQSSGAEVVVSSDGKFVYGSNRGNDSIAIFSIADGTGKLTLVGHQSTGGATPRSFAIDPSGNFLLVANQGTNNVVTFRIDRSTGMLSQMVATPVSTGPEFVGAFVIPPS